MEHNRIDIKLVIAPLSLNDVWSKGLEYFFTCTEFYWYWIWLFLSLLFFFILLSLSSHQHMEYGLWIYERIDIHVNWNIWRLFDDWFWILPVLFFKKLQHQELNNIICEFHRISDLISQSLKSIDWLLWHVSFDELWVVFCISLFVKLWPDVKIIMFST